MPSPRTPVSTDSRLDRLTGRLGDLVIQADRLDDRNLRKATDTLLPALYDALREAGYGEYQLRPITSAKPAQAQPGEAAMRLMWRLLWSWRSPKIAAISQPLPVTRLGPHRRSELSRGSSSAGRSHAHSPGMSPR